MLMVFLFGFSYNLGACTITMAELLGYFQRPATSKGLWIYAHRNRPLWCPFDIKCLWLTPSLLLPSLPD
jgi:hypothetical protein